MAKRVECTKSNLPLEAVNTAAVALPAHCMTDTRAFMVVTLNLVYIAADKLAKIAKISFPKHNV